MALPINPPSHDYEPESESAGNLLDGRRDDVVVAVMGSTGTGKSSFIKLLTGDDSVTIGDSLESETSDVQVLHFLDPPSSRNVAIVDTPGFGDSRSDVTDTNILQKITNYLLEEYDQHRKLNGLIYVQRISDNRFSSQSRRNLRMFRALCGVENYKNVVVLTTHWDKVPTHEGVRRETQLKSNFFRDLAAGGARFMRHDRTLESARQVLRHILAMPPTVTRIQKEIREEGKSLGDTAAGSVHSEEVERELAKCKNELTELRAEMATLKEGNRAAIQELNAERAELQRALARLDGERSKLKEQKKQVEGLKAMVTVLSTVTFAACVAVRLAGAARGSPLTR